MTSGMVQVEIVVPTELAPPFLEVNTFKNRLSASSSMRGSREEFVNT
jgi:hypothetical protein